MFVIVISSFIESHDVKTYLVGLHNSKGQLQRFMLESYLFIVDCYAYFSHSLGTAIHTLVQIIIIRECVIVEQKL